MEVYEVKAMLTADWKSFEAGLKGAMASINEFKSSTGDMASVGSALKGVGAGLTLGVTAPLVGIGAASAKAAISFESAMAGVRKTTELTDQEFKEMGDGIRQMATEIPATTTEIAGVAEAAGQLGIGKEHILDFSRTMIDLKNTTNLTSEQAATSFARFANITQMPQSAFENLGSTVVDLGNNLATTEAEIVDMGMRLAGTGNQVGLSGAQIMGLAGALSSVGIGAEAGGSAFSRVMQKMNTQVISNGDKLQGFAAIAGMSAEEFASKWKTAPQEAITSFVSGLGKAKDSGADVVSMLGELGINGIRETDALLRLSGAGDLLANSFDMATTSFEENTALSKEAQQRYETLESQLKITIESFKDVGRTIGIYLMPYIKDFALKLKELADKFRNLSPEQQEMIIKIGLLAAAIGPLLTIIGSVIGKFTAITSTVKLVAGGFMKLFGLFAANPWLLLVAGIAVAAVAIYKHWDEIKEFMSQTWQAIKEGASDLWDGITEKVGSVVDGIQEKWSGFKEKMSETWSNIKEGASTAWDNIKTTVSDKATAIKDSAKEKIDGLKEKIGTTWDNIKTAAGTSWDNIKSTVTDKASTIKDGAKEKIGGLKEQLSSDWEGMKSKAKTSWDNIKTSVVDTTNNIKSKTQEIWTAVKTDAKAKWDGISNQVKSSTNTMKTNIQSGFGNMKSAVNTKVTEFGNSVKKGFTDMVSKAKSSMSQLISSVKQGFAQAVSSAKGFVGQAISAGGNLIKGFVQGVTQFAGKLISAVKDAVGNAISAAKRLLRIGSPSKVFKEIGGFTMEGFAIGIDKESKTAVNSMKNVVDDVIGTYKPIDNIPQLDNLKSKATSQIEYQVNDNLSQKQPATINLRLGDRNFRAVVDDITNIQGKVANFEEVYSW
ncbi:phage tail tape measure protein [Peptoniphilus raoultii]|uniref:phage tail tape measure protein n=1 Tax=Peptoniphilus raoultii TaxID=1776387 RepID=UPI0008DA91AD|nr:phage tail tape measure protein [Peptoniphilus raoultii]